MAHPITLSTGVVPADVLPDDKHSTFPVEQRSRMYAARGVERFLRVTELIRQCRENVDVDCGAVARRGVRGFQTYRLERCLPHTPHDGVV